MWCPGCQQETICAARNLSAHGLRGGQRQRHEDQEINWFRRARECLSCGETYLTVELNEDYLDELIELRKALADVKTHAEEYTHESSRAARALRRLSESLKVLRALHIYQREEA